MNRNLPANFFDPTLYFSLHADPSYAFGTDQLS